MTSITSEEVNYLIYRYLQEAGFVHSAFTFNQESFISKADIKAASIPPGMLVTLLQKGLHYTSIEFHLNDDGTEKDCNKPYSLLEPHSCEKLIPPQRPITPAIRGPKSTFSSSSTATISTTTSAAITGSIMTDNSKDLGKKRKKNSTADNELSEVSGKSNNATTVASATKKVTTEKRTSKNSQNGHVLHFDALDVKFLTGHQSEVITCSWNPSSSVRLLASASGDGTVRMWTVPSSGIWDVDEAIMTVRVLEHIIDVVETGPNIDGLSKDVTTMDWSPNGQILATGSYDGKARLWSIEGDLLAVLEKHNGPIFQLQWSPNGRYLVSTGGDPSVVIWDAENRILHRSFDHGGTPALDVDWRDNHCFSTCSTNKLVYVYNIDSEMPKLVLSGHQDEVNSIKWSPSGDLLVSSSDDTTAKIWRISDDLSTGILEFNLAGHTQGIYTAKWSKFDGNLLVATASVDSTVRIWDGKLGNCLHILKHHSQPVYAMSFSPSGRFLASGSLDAVLNIWRTSDGQLVKSHTCRGGIMEIRWCPTGDRIAVATSDPALCVFEFDSEKVTDQIINRTF